MKLLLWMAIALFGLKFAWNLLVPYMLGVELLRSKPGSTRTRGISLMPWVEILLTFIAGSLSSQTTGDGFVYKNGAKIVAAGFGAIIFSVLHFVVVGSLFGLVARNRIKERG